MSHLILTRGVGRALLAKRSAALDVDATAWAAAVASAGGTVKGSTLTAVSNFVKSAKANGYWSKLNRINLFCGDQLAAAVVPLKVGSGNATDTIVNFVAGDYSEATGLTGNGTNKSLDTGIVPSTALTLNSTHLSVYASTNGMTPGVHIGARGTGLATQLWASFTDGFVYSDQYNATSELKSASAPTKPAGHVIGTTISGSDHSIYVRGTKNGTGSPSSGGLPTVSIRVFATNSGGTTASWVAQTLSAYSIGSGLSASDAANFYTDMQAFQTALGRNV